MLDLKFVRENIGIVEESLRLRNTQLSLANLKQAEVKRRELLQHVETLKAEKNKGSEEIAIYKKEKKDAASLIKQTQEQGERIKGLETDLAKVEEELKAMMLLIPNIPDASVPQGKDDDDNKEVRRWGTPPDLGFEALAHWDLGEKLDILDLDKATQISGARFPLYKGAGAQLERAILNFMLDLHTQKHGYREVLPPYLVSPDTMQGSGQLPKFEQELFKCRDDDYYLIPTAEVPLNSLHKGEILDGGRLPLYYTAYTPCFRREAGSYGKDTRGLIRQHQFNKVELFKFCRPEDSMGELEKLTHDAEEVLQLLKLPYRVVQLCSGSLGFASAKTYDLEVWLAGSKTYREISSCSNCLDFQARRSSIRFRRDKQSRPEFVHTLNGSGLAVGRTWIAIVENYQQRDGSILIPDALRPYMHGMDRIRKA